MSSAPPAEYPDPSARRARVSPQRRQRLGRRLAPLVLLGVGAFAGGIVVGASHESSERQAAKRFVAAWTRGDYGGMYQLLSPSSRAAISVGRFRRRYEQAAETATLQRVERTGPLRQRGDRYEAPMRAVTERFGAIDGTLAFEVATEENDLSGVVFEPRLVFPGLRDGEELSRTTEMPPRADLQARDGSVLASGPDRTSPIGPLAAEVVGQIGPIPEELAERFAMHGYPEDAVVGLTGLERQFEERLAGTFGGTLRAGTRLLKQVQPQSGDAVRTSIDLEIEQAAVTALAGRLGGIAVLRPQTGEVLALAGLGYSAPQPPGSTFKIITLAGALEEGIVTPKDSFPVQQAAILSGVELENAHGEFCGGTLMQSFAKSCNSVFAPMGAELGAEKLVEYAELFGFNRADDITGAPPGSIPAPGEIGDDLAVGSSAIGQGIVTSTPLRMAEVAGVIANNGVLVRPTLLRGDQGAESRAVSAKTANTITKFMRAVVAPGGTGSAAAVPGVAVAGKTGTAELRTTQPDEELPPDPNAPPVDDASDTDAWFVAFAPAKKPDVVVAVLLVGSGAGGATAAPAAKVVLDAVF